MGCSGWTSFTSEGFSSGAALSIHHRGTEYAERSQRRPTFLCSPCPLRILCVSGASRWRGARSGAALSIHHRDTENAERSQRRPRFLCSPCPLRILCVSVVRSDGAAYREATWWRGARSGAALSIHHRGTENAQRSQRKPRFLCSPCPLRILCVSVVRSDGAVYREAWATRAENAERSQRKPTFLCSLCSLRILCVSVVRSDGAAYREATW